MCCPCIAFAWLIASILVKAWGSAPKVLLVAYQGPWDCVMNSLLYFMLEIALRICDTNNKFGMVNLSKK